MLLAKGNVPTNQVWPNDSNQSQSSIYKFHLVISLGRHLQLNVRIHVHNLFSATNHNAVHQGMSRDVTDQSGGVGEAILSSIFGFVLDSIVSFSIWQVDVHQFHYFQNV